jgi:uncharacterized oligopeptide transporter (OPT) family protein
MASADVPRRRFLPAPETPAYHLLLGAVALLILGPLGGVTAAYMTFSLGFFVGGQVLAGILGSVVTYGYGAEGKHGANYMQTMAASVASMSGMGVLIQGMVWLGIPLPPAWALFLYFGCIGMFGIGVGMLYTPILVEKMKLEYPSGHAVANILRALTDKRLLRRSVGKLGGGAVGGIAASAIVEHVRVLGSDGLGLSMSTIGTGLIIGSRIAVPALVMGGSLWLLAPHFRAMGWLGPHDPPRKIGFLIALAMIMGAAVVDLALLAVEALRRFRAVSAPGPTAPSESRLAAGGLGARGLLAWVVLWGAAIVVVAAVFLHQPPGFVLMGVALSFVFVFVNGISNGISDSNPISSAFVVSVLLMSLLGLRDPAVGMMAASVLLVACTVGVDMQQDRSTGWRLGSDRRMQFRYQAVGIVMGAALCVGFASVFMRFYPVLRIDTFTHPEAKVDQWQSAMTFKFVGTLRGLGHLASHQIRALAIGFAIGVVLQIARKALARSTRWSVYQTSSAVAFSVGWVVDAILLASPYASSFGGFVDVSASVWMAAGGVVASALATLEKRRRVGVPVAGADELPADMSTNSLVGGGLIAGEALFTLFVGIMSFIASARALGALNGP